MPTLLNVQSKTLFAESFITSLSTDALYLFIGKTTAWANESVPDTITNSVLDTTQVLNDVIAIKRLNEANACLVVPRINWTLGVIYDEYSHYDPALETKTFYVLTADMSVYKCISNADGSVSTSQPTGQSTSEITTADGYVWKFMYNLSSTVQSNFLTIGYLPVPTGDKKTAQQVLVETSAVYALNSPPGGHGHNAAFELGATKVAINQRLEGSEGGVISVSSQYREVGIVSGVKLNNGDDATGNIYSVGDSNSTIDMTSAQVVYVETLSPVQRNSDQTETIKIAIDFNQ